jgi:hypothetical protein
MKTHCGPLLCAALLVFGPIAWAGLSDLNITCEKKKMTGQAGSEPQQHSVGVTKSEQWGYAVTVENQGFKNLSNLDVKYKIFYKHEQLGIKGPPKKETKTGDYPIPEIDSLGKTSFDTVSVTLSKSSLLGPMGGYSYFDNGAKPTATDTLTGIWVRVYQNGTLIGESAYPSDLTSEETWQ